MRIPPAKHPVVRSAGAAALCALLLAVGTAGPAAATPLFSALPGGLSEERYAPVLLALPSGKALVAGGGGEATPLKTAELFDPASGKTERLEGPGHELVEAREEAGSALLADGKGLIVGGGNTSPSLTTAELYDPATNTFEKLTHGLGEPRSGAAVVPLPSGKALVVGGSPDPTSPAEALASAEIFDPVTGAFTKVAKAMSVGRYAPAAGLLPNGTVLIAGGSAVPLTPGALRSAEVFVPATETFEKLPAEMLVPRTELASTTLSDGELLLAGGAGPAAEPLNSAEVFNPVTGSFEAISSRMTLKRRGPAAALLADGAALIAGGASGGPARSVEQLAFPPAVTSSTATLVTQSTALLSGTALAEVPSTVRFQYGPTVAYGASAPAQPFAASILPQSAVAHLAGLAAGTAYHYRLVAENLFGTSFGPDSTFVTTPLTKKPPPLQRPPQPPLLTAVAESHTLWREPHRHPHHRNAPIGTTFTFALNERATVTFSFTQLLPGRKVGRRCLAPTHRNRHRHACTRTRGRGSLLLGGRLHRNAVPFKGQVSSGAILPAGSYTVQIVATNAKGLRSATARLSFRIVN